MNLKMVSINLERSLNWCFDCSQKLMLSSKDNPIRAIQKIEDFVGIDHFLNSSNFERQEETDMYCMRLEKDDECNLPVGNKRRTVHKQG